MSDVSKRLAELSPERRRLLELRLKLAEARAAGPVPRPRPDGTAPLSFAQQRLWVIDRMQPGGAFYTMPHPLRVSGPLDAGALGRALAALAARHESLRTTFAERGGVPVQVIHPPAPVGLPVDDLSALAPAEREAEVRRRIDADANTGFDLEAGPLFRARLLRLGADEHVLLLCMHHIVSDGWSMGVLQRELGALYAAFRAGRPDPLPPPALQYADFAAWQREHLSGETLRRHLDFWRRALEGAPPALELPTDRPRPAVESHRGRMVRREVPAALADALRELARETGGTLFAVLLAGLRVVLARHAGHDDVVVGTPVANRSRSEVEGLVGFFVNTLALRAAVPGDPAFRELARHEAEAALRAFNHQDLPFDRLVEELKLPRDPGRNPVFQVMLTLQNARMEPPELPGCTVTPLRPEYDTAKFDLIFDFYEEDGGALRLDVQYATDLFDEATAGRLAAHLLGVLQSAAADPGRRRSELEPADEAERAFVLAAAGPAATDYPRDNAVHRLFERQAARTPHAVAVEFGEERLTYAELDARANRLARRLRAAGVGAEHRVGVAVERSAELVVALLAVLKAGGAYVPLDAAYPPERLAFMLEDAGVSALVVREGVPAALASFAGPVVTVEGDGETAPAGETDLDVEVDAEGLAYVLYTSGSTGRPKGVGVPHRAVVRLVRETDYADLGPEQVFLQLVPVAFDVSTFELWAPLLNGGRLAVAPPGAPSLREIAELVRRHGVTTLWLTSGLLHRMVDEELEALGALSQLLAGGDVLSVPHVRRVLEAHPHLRVINGYGPTENTTFTTCHTVRPADAERVSIPMGRPIANTSAHVLDEGLRPCPLGVPGELYAGGDGVARGYLGRPGATAAAFVPDPFSPTPGARLYRTGDRVRRLEDGTLEFLGRIDQQVKVRGIRVEPGEVEAALKAHPGVGDAVVVARADGGDRRLVGYLTARNGSAPPAAELRAWVASRLPEHMVPSAFVALAAIPLTPNGKVDRRALPVPEMTDEGEAYAAPRTPTEEVLAGIWAEVLGVERVGIDDDFFLLGGHSLLATQVVSRVLQAFGVEVPLRVAFEAPTVRRLAARVEALRALGGEAAPPVAPVPRGGPLPLSFAQERLWFLERLMPRAAVYNMPVRLRLEGALDAEALRRAWESVLARHEALRTRYAEVEGQPVQEAAPPARFELPVLELPDADAAAEWLAAEAWRPFDLRHGPLVRAALLRFSAAEHVLALNVHHSVADGWSLGIVFREVSAAYAALRRGEAPQLPPVPLQYADFAAWQRAWLAGERIQAQLDHWRSALEGAPALLELPTDRPRAALRRHRGAVQAVALAPELAARLKALARQEGATPFMALLAGFQALLARWSGQDDVVVGSPIAGRTRAETEGIVGFFVNMLPLRAELAGSPTFRELLAQVRRRTLDAYAHQDLPFERVVEELRVERSLSHTPVFQAAFALQNAPLAELRLPGVQARDLEIDPRAAKFDLSLDLAEAEGGIAGVLEYDVDLFDAATAERMARHFETLLEAALAEPDRPLARLPGLLAGEERRRVLGEWSCTEHPFPLRPVHELFEAQADAAPGRAAISYGGAEISYAELDERANRLAHHLIARGVGPEARVGLFAERAPETVAAILAILKAGGAWLPLDPSNPVARLAWMASDAGVSTLVATADVPAELAAAVGDVVDLRKEGDGIAARPAGRPRVAVDPDHLAYVIYTSGSTGLPKGVLVAHRGVPNMALAQARRFRIGPGSRVLQFASLSFDASVLELFVTLLAGGTLVVAPREALAAGPALLETLGRERVTAVVLPPSVLAVLAPEELPELRTLVSAGEAVSAAVVERWAPGRRFMNDYGPTEGTVATAGAVCAPDGRAPAIGRPFENVRVYVLDAGGEPVPVGVPGELFVGGPGVARGYHGRPALTAERFVPDPLSGEPGARLYRSGDRVRWRGDGELQFLGRTDEQVKLRGFRVEPGEVAAVLASLPGVRDALALVREHAGDRRLAAWAVAEPGAERPDPAELRAELRRRLPDYMVPAAVVVVDDFPRTPNGKVDRAALPLPDPEAGAAFVAPQGELEQRVAAVWREVLGRGAVGVNDSFFEIGGHSLLLARLHERLQAALGIEVTLVDLFQFPTVAAQAERIERQAKAARGEPAQGPKQAGRDRGSARRQALIRKR